jgi:DNA invertase Pin-like site-specific DNA recombinase
VKTNELETMTHSLITAEHLRRKAVVVYTRHSLAYGGDTGRQQEKLQLARRYGWPKDLIELIDEDVGKGGSSVEHRAGYQRLLTKIRRGTVGAVFAANRV